MKFFHSRKGSCKSGNSANLLHSVVKGRDHRHPYDQCCFSGERNLSGIFQHQLIGFSRKLPVLFGICMFDIHQIKIQIRQYLLNAFKRRTRHTFDCRINAPLLRCPEKISGKLRLAETFSSGKSHSSPGAIIIRPVFFHLGDHFRHCGVFPDHLILSKYLHGLYPVFLRFRITAPAAPQDAAFEKNNGADSRPVVNRVSLNIKNPAPGI